MLNFSSTRRIFLARAATDMRRGIDRLVSTVATELGEDPRAGGRSAPRIALRRPADYSDKAECLDHLAAPRSRKLHHVCSY